MKAGDRLPPPFIHRLDGMTTEKKKRTPKPAMTPEVRTVIASIPFLNFTWKDQHRIANEEALLEVFRPVVQELFPGLLSADQIKARTLWVDDSEPMTHVRETQIISASILRDLAKEAEPKRPPPEWLNEAQAALDSLRVRLRLFPAKMVIEPSIADEDRNTWRLIAKTARTLLIKSVVSAFQADGAGPFYVGACPRCGKIFEKKQANAAFCSYSCGSADRMARWREK